TEFWKSQLSSIQNDHVEEIENLKLQYDENQMKLRDLLTENEKLSSRLQSLQSNIEHESTEKIRLNQLLSRSNEQKTDLQLQVIELQKVIILFFAFLFLTFRSLRI